MKRWLATLKRDNPRSGGCRLQYFVILWFQMELEKNEQVSWPFLSWKDSEHKTSWKDDMFLVNVVKEISAGAFLISIKDSRSSVPICGFRCISLGIKKISFWKISTVNQVKFSNTSPRDIVENLVPYNLGLNVQIYRLEIHSLTGCR